MENINQFLLTLFYFWQNISYLNEISMSDRRGLEEILAFNRNKTDQHIEKWQHFTNFFKMLILRIY